MPNRIIKESLCTSEKIASLSDFEFRLWIGLITQVDDAGRGDARPAVIKGRVFPFRDRLTIKDVDAALHGLADKGCVTLYDVDGRPYFYFPSWTKHQRIRDCKPKYPEPCCDNLRPSAASCGELPQAAALIQSESNPNPNPNPNPKARAELFARFWDAYPKKKAKQDAQKAWDKLKPDEELTTTIIAAVLRFTASPDWTKDGGRYIPFPATFLNGHRWEDDIGPAQSRYSNLERLYQEMEGKDDD